MSLITTLSFLTLVCGFIAKAESVEEMVSSAPSTMPGVTAGLVDVADYFPEVNDDMSQVTWGHRVNSKDDLESKIADPNVMMLEADVLRGWLVDEDEEESSGTSSPQHPIMAHPPEEKSDLTLAMWLDRIIEANQAGTRKGIKLDFKDSSIVRKSLEELKKRQEQLVFPVWLNADIIPGPVNATATPVDPSQFIPLCLEHFPQGTLSLGWTTQFTNPDDVSGEYSQAMVEAMASTLEQYTATSHPVTFPVRAAFVTRSLDAIEWLVDTVPDCTITVWSSPTDTTDPMALLALRDSVGAEAVFFDLPPDQMQQLREASEKEAASVSAAKFRFLPTNASAWATGAVALASALAALYLYE